MIWSILFIFHPEVFFLPSFYFMLQVLQAYPIKILSFSRLSKVLDALREIFSIIVRHVWVG